MRIALDARKLDDFGIGTYIRGLVTAMALARPADRFVLIGDPKAAGLGWPDNVSWIADESSKYGLAELVRLGRRAAEARADVFHAPHYVYPTSLPCPGVVTIHDCIHLRFPEHLPRVAGILPRGLSAAYARQMIRHAGRRASRVLTVSEASAEDIVTFGAVPRERISVVPNGCDSMYRRPATAQELKAAEAIATTAPYALFAGNDKPHKNLIGLLHAHAALAGERPLQLVIVGGAQPQARPGLVAAGRVDAATLRGLVARARMVVVPSLYEGFGLPALEAMAAGVPVIASDAGGLPEVVGEAGLLVPAGDDDALAAAMARLRDDDVLHDRLARSGVERAARFTWAAAAAATLETYDAAVSGEAA